MGNNELESKNFTKEQLERQAGAFRLLNKRIKDYYKQQETMPIFIRDDEEAQAESVATLTRWIIEEHDDDLKPIVS